jgi:CheY-like chemotaxis protein
MGIQAAVGNPSVRIVVIDDDLAFLDFVGDALGETGLEIVTSSSPEEGLELILSARTDLVLLDVNLPGQTGFDVLEKIVKANPTTNVILLTAEYSTDSAVEAIQKGAADFLNKPISVDALRTRVSKFVETARERRGAMQVSHELKEVFQFEGIVGWSPLMLEVFDRIRRVASHFKNILVCGETGTGKELVARSLHHLSPFSSGPFIVCNCAAMVETLFESELFGHVKGAFTGALLPCFWTKSATLPRAPRSSCCACCRIMRYKELDPPPFTPWMYALSQQRIATCARWSRQRNSEKISTTESPPSKSSCHDCLSAGKTCLCCSAIFWSVMRRSIKSPFAEFRGKLKYS